jgi:hypothetical protein
MSGGPSGVEATSGKQTVFAWLQCGPEDGESNSTTLRNFGLLLAGCYALAFAFWRAKIADTEKNINLRGSQTNQSAKSDFPSDPKWTGANFANANFSGSHFEGANFGWGSSDVLDQETTSTRDADENPNGGKDE